MVAVKKLTPYIQERKFSKELECLVTAKHKNVVRILGFCSDTQKTVDYLDGKFLMPEIKELVAVFWVCTKWESSWAH